MKTTKNERSPAVREFIAAADEYCHLIESHRRLSRQKFLSRISFVLPRLYSAALHLPSIDSKGDFEEPRLSNEDWQVLFKNLRRKLGPHDRYWEFFNPYVKDDPVTRSLADDLADIYRDIQPGLKLYRYGSKGARGAAIWNWRFGLTSHWGHHATDALRALQQLRSEYRL